VSFQVGEQEFSVYAIMLKAVHEFILGIDFLAENECHGTSAPGMFCCTTTGYAFINAARRRMSDRCVFVVIVPYHPGSK